MTDEKAHRGGEASEAGHWLCGARAAQVRQNNPGFYILSLLFVYYYLRTYLITLNRTRITASITGVSPLTRQLDANIVIIANPGLEVRPALSAPQSCPTKSPNLEVLLWPGC